MDECPSCGCIYIAELDIRLPRAVARFFEQGVEAGRRGLRLRPPYKRGSRRDWWLAGYDAGTMFAEVRVVVY